MREPVGIGQQQRDGRNAAAKARQRRMKRAIGRIGSRPPLLPANTGRWLDAFSSAGRACPGTGAGKVDASAFGMVDLLAFDGRSVQRMAVEQIRSGLDHPFAMLEHPIAVAANEVELMLAAFLTHRPDVLDGMRARHLRDELREQVHFGLRPLERFHCRRKRTPQTSFFGSRTESWRPARWPLPPGFGPLRRRLLNGRHCNCFRMLWHDNLLSCGWNAIVQRQAGH